MNANKIIKGVVTVTAICIALLLLWYLSRVVLYVLLSAVLAIVGRPLVKYLQRLRIGSYEPSRTAASIVTLVVMWLVAGGLIALFVPLVFDKVNDLASLDIDTFMAAIRRPVEDMQLALQHLFAFSEFSIDDTIRTYLSSFIHNNLVGAFSDVAGLMVTAAISLFSVTFITFYFLKEDGLFYRLVALFFPERFRGNVYHALDSITMLLSRYFGGLLVESMLVMTIISVILTLFGLPFDDALMIGLIMGVMNLIPYAGPVIGCVVSLCIGVLSPMGGDVGHAATLITLTIICVKVVDDFVIQPTLYSRRVQAHPLEVFLVILIAGYVAGMWGMLLAIPLYTVLRVFAREFFSEYSLVRRLTGQMTDDVK